MQWHPSNLDTIGREESVLTREVSLFQGLKSTQIWYLGMKKVSCLERCPYFRGVLIEGLHCSLNIMYIPVATCTSIWYTCVCRFMDVGWPVLNVWLAEAKKSQDVAMLVEVMQVRSSQYCTSAYHIRVAFALLQNVNVCACWESGITEAFSSFVIEIERVLKVQDPTGIRMGFLVAEEE